MKPGFLILLALVALISGCGIFETRNPEAPQQGQSDFVPPTLPSIVVDNLTSAIADQNVNNYIACFSNAGTGGRAFSFQPSAKAAQQYQTVFQNWDRSSEEAYFNNLKSYTTSSTRPALVLTNINLIPSSDSAYYSADYTLFWSYKGTEGFQTTQGNLQFFLAQDQTGNWAIYRWVDTGNSDTVKTWSFLKAAFSVQ